jgi:predicted outer membrane repeat protein
VFDLTQQENYGYISTNLSGIEFSSLPKPDVSLQELIDSANDGDTRYIPSGCYNNTTTYHITKNLTLIGTGIVVANAERNCEILHVENPNATVKIENIVFVNGKGEHGGAVDSIAKDLTLINCTFLNNIAEEGASINNIQGDLHIINSSITRNLGFNSIIAIENGTLVLDNVNLVNNTAFQFCNGITISNTRCLWDVEENLVDNIKNNDTSDYQLIVRNCTFSNNQGYATNGLNGGYGISIVRAIDIKMLIEDSEFTTNSMELEGGIIYAGNCSMTIRNCSICDNKVTKLGIGCGILLSSGSDALLEMCRINNNVLPSKPRWPNYIEDFRGGGIMISENASATLNKCQVNGNEGGFGAGIYNAGTLILKEGEVSSNIALPLDLNDSDYGGYGGAIYNKGTLDITGSNISNNIAQNGGAIYNTGTVKSDGHTIFQNNSAQDGGAIYNKGSINLTGTPTFVSNEAIDTGEDDYREGMGGAIFNAGNMTIENGVFTGNKAISGSSIWNKGNLTDTDSKYSNNYAGAAGTIFHKQNAMILNNTTIVENIVDENGGGIYTSGFLVVTGGLMDNNVAKIQGGALYCIPGYSSAPVSVYLDGLNMRNNTASQDGGAICSSGKVALEISNTEIAICVAGGNGGGVFLNADSSIDLENSAIKNNIAKKGGGIYLTKGSTMTGNRNQVHDNKPDNIYQAK